MYNSPETWYDRRNDTATKGHTVVEYVYRWDFHLGQFCFYVEVDADSRVGRWLERRGF